MIESKTNDYSCPRCTVGRCHHQTASFVDIYDGQLFCVPDTPIFVCDVCHFAEFELGALESLWNELDADSFTDEFLTLSEKSRSPSIGD
jgi:hypothetical protein